MLKFIRFIKAFRNAKFDFSGMFDSLIEVEESD